MALGTRAGQGAHPLALLGVGHAPALQDQLEVLGGRITTRGQPLEPADGGQLGQRPELLPQHVLQHLGRRGAQEAGRSVHGVARGRPAARAFHGGTWGRTRCAEEPGRGPDHLCPSPGRLTANPVLVSGSRSRNCFQQAAPVITNSIGSQICTLQSPGEFLFFL